MSNGTAKITKPSLPLITRFIYFFGKPLCLVFMNLFYRLKREGMERIPQEGSVLLVSNHQSFYDPVILGLLNYKRPFRSIARSGLFNFRPLGWLIRSYGAIPLVQGKGDRAALRASIDALKEGSVLIMYPEGARTRDGVTHTFERGFMFMWKKSKAPLLPVVIEGAFDIWPIMNRLPKLQGRITVRTGDIIRYEDVAGKDETEVMRSIQKWMETERLVLREQIRKDSNARYPTSKVGDEINPEFLVDQQDQ